MTDAKAADPAAIPRYRRPLAVFLLVILFFPALILILATGPVYYRKRKVGLVPWPTWMRVIVLLGLIGFLLLQLGRLLGDGGGGAGGGGRVSELPACDSRQAVRELKVLVKNSPMGRTQGVELIDLLNGRMIHDLEHQRGCLGQALTNGGQRVLYYTFSWTDRAKGTYFVEARFGS